jgi:hypothetical protein
MRTPALDDLETYALSSGLGSPASTCRVYVQDSIECDLFQHSLRCALLVDHLLCSPPREVRSVPVFGSIPHYLVDHLLSSSRVQTS